jgi:hypothetical protein
LQQALQLVAKGQRRIQAEQLRADKAEERAEKAIAASEVLRIRAENAETQLALLQTSAVSDKPKEGFNVESQH